MRYYLTTEELRAVQLTQLELLQEAKRVCEKCGIRYTIIAGTLLGAVRHGGYIPWDDDADIAMLRGEYERFREACNRFLNHEKFYFQDDRNTEGYRWGYGKLRKKGTLFLREGQEDMPYEQGIFIDIFPLDYVSDNYLVRTLQNFKCFCIRKILWSRVGKNVDSNPLKRIVYRVLNQIPEAYVKKCFNKYIRKCVKEETEWVRILMLPTPNRQYGYLEEWYVKTKPIAFEGIEFNGIEAYNDYLSFKFGNYMELPPESERKAHPVSRLELGRT